MMNRCRPLTVFAVVAFSPFAQAGVRHSRSLNGTGQPIPRSQDRQPNVGDPNLNQGIPVPVQAPNQAPIQIPGQPYGGAQLPVQAPVPMPIPPPMPVQIPTQAGQQETIQTPQQITIQAPVQVAPETPVSAPVVVPPPIQVQVPAQLQQQTAEQNPAPSSNGTQQTFPYQMPEQGLPNTPAQPPGQSQFAAPPQKMQPSEPVAPIVQPLQQSSQPFPIQGQPSLPPAPPGSVSGDRYMLPTYGMAGCGLGSMIFTKNSRSEQWIAAIVNDAFLPQSSAISTGTSNCVDVDEEQSQAEQEIFVDSNFHALRIDAARGDGESLRAYAELLGCYKEGLFDTFASLSQGQYPFIFSDSQPQSVAERYRDALKRSRALKTRCDRLF